MSGTPTPEQMELLRQARRVKLMQIWASGSRRLSADERSEIADLIGEPDMPPPEPAPPAFSLQPGAPLPAKLRNYYRHPYVAYTNGRDGAPNYNRTERTIKRWVSAGRSADPVALPPLDSPGTMAAWFRTIFPGEAVPAELLDYELAAPQSPQASHEAPPVAGPPPSPPAGEKMKAMDLTGIDPEADASVRRAAILEEANGRRVQDASAEGDSAAYRRWFPIWQDSAELLRKLIKEDREARKQSGLLLDKAAVLGELAQLLEALRIMREGMPAKILAELAKTDDRRLRRILRVLSPALRAAVEKVRASESAIFHALETVHSPADLRAALDHAA